MRTGICVLVLWGSINVAATSAEAVCTPEVTDTFVVHAAQNADSALGTPPGLCPLGSGVDAGKGVCPSLRAAIVELNYDAAHFCKTAIANNTITLDATIYELTIKNVAGDEDLSLYGDLDIAANVTIQGQDQGNFHTEVVTNFAPGGYYYDRVFDVLSPATVVFSKMIIQGGQALNLGTLGGSGGGILAHSGTTVTVNDVFFNVNTAASEGGALFSEGATVNLTRVTVVANTVTNGDGGGLAVNRSSASGATSIVDSLFEGNTVTTGDGGAIYSNQPIFIDRTSFVKNSATLGGGIFIAGDPSSGSLTASNVTIAANSATANGGGIYDDEGAASALNNVTVAQNLATTGREIYWNPSPVPSGTFSLHNSIVSGAPDPTSNCVVGSGAFTSLGSNIDDGATCGFGQSGDLSSKAAELTPLFGGGGTLTDDACGLRAGSPALGAGDATDCGTSLNPNVSGAPTDQRGVPRPAAGCDIGATQHVSFTVDSLLDTGDAIAGDGLCDDGAGHCTLRAALDETNALVGADSISLPTPGVYLVGIALYVADDLTLATTGAANAQNTFIDAANLVQAMRSFGWSSINAASIYYEPSIAFTGFTVRNGVSSSGGGALYIDGAFWLIDQSAFIGNQGNQGGAIDFGAGPGLAISNSLFGNNSTVAGASPADGGALYLSANAGLTNVTLTGNTAANGGGALCVSTGQTVLLNATLSQNTANGAAATNGGGVLVNGTALPGEASLVIANTILAQNSDTTGAGPDCALGGTAANAIFYSQKQNLLGVVDGCAFIADPTDQVGADPKLVALADNGGPTLTEALALGSAAINGVSAESCAASAFDQRHVARPHGVGGSGACDIGAFETTAADVSITASLAPVNSGLGAAAVETFTITNAGPNAATGVSLGATLQGTMGTITTSQGVCTQSGQTLTCPIGYLPLGSTVTVTVQLTATAPAVVSNSATVTADGSDPNLANNTAASGGYVDATSLVLSDAAVVTTSSAGAHVTFTLSLVNQGPNPASAIVISEQIPSGTTLVSATPSAGTCTSAVCTIGALASGASANIVVTVLAKTAGNYSDAGSVVAAQPQLSSAVLAASATATVTAAVAKPVPAGGCHCSSGGANPFESAALLLVVLIWLERRRFSRRSSARR